MPRDSFSDLAAFRAVAAERSFTRAAAKLGVSQSALSHAVRGLEARLGIRLLARTTRSVAPTEAGERLLATIAPAFEAIDSGLAAMGSYRDTPAGTFRITAGEHAVETLLWPKLSRLMAAYPDIGIEFTVDAALTDIVAERYDAGVRLGEQVARDMIAVRIGPDMRMAVVGAPGYLDLHPAPQTPHALTAHRCINLRLPTYGGFYAWEFERDGRDLRVRVEGQVACNSTRQVLAAAMDGFGLACVPQDEIEGHVAAGRLVRVLADWCPPFPGYHLYYPSRRQPSAAFNLIVEALRHRDR